MSIAAIPRRPGVHPQLRAAGRALTTAALALGGIALVVLGWALLSSVAGATRVPSPSAVWQAMFDDWSEISAVTYVTFEATGIGEALKYTGVGVVGAVAVGTAIGLPFGIVIARSRVVARLTEIPLLVLGTVPLLIVLPFITIWFGTARAAQSGLVLLFTALTVTIAAQNAATSVAAHFTNLATCLGASRARILWTVVLPASLPDVIGAVRVALAAGWGLQCVAELLGSSVGIGRVIEVTASIQATTDLVATLVWVVLAAVAIDALVAAAGGYLVRWKEPGA